MKHLFLNLIPIFFCLPNVKTIKEIKSYFYKLAVNVCALSAFKVVCETYTLLSYSLNNIRGLVTFPFIIIMNSRYFFSVIKNKTYSLFKYSEIENKTNILVR